MLSSAVLATLHVLYTFAAALCLYLAVIVHRMVIRHREHGVLTWAAIALFTWNAGAYVVYSMQSPASLVWLLPVSCIPMFFFAALHFHFVLVLLTGRALRPWMRALLYVPAMLFSLLNFLVPISVRLGYTASGRVRMEAAVGSALNLLWLGFAAACVVVPLILYRRFYRRTNVDRHRRQAVLLFRVTTAVSLLVFGEYLLFAVGGGRSLPMQSPLFASLWAAGILYAVRNYGLLKLSSVSLTQELLEAIEGLVVLYGVDGRRMYANRRALALLGKDGTGGMRDMGGSEGITVMGGMAPSPDAAPSSDAAPSPALCAAGDPIASVVAQHVGAPETWVRDQPARCFRLPLAPIHDTTTPQGGVGHMTLDVRARPVFDRFDDPLGVLVTATVVPQYRGALARFGATAREAEVFECLAAGWSIRHTAEALAISQRTVKAHISHLYLKTGARNRVELVNSVGPVWSQDDGSSGAAPQSQDGPRTRRAVSGAPGPSSRTRRAPRDDGPTSLLCRPRCDPP